MAKTRQEARLRRKKRIRKKVNGTPERPRLVVYRSLRHITAQIVDDASNSVLACVSTVGKGAAGDLGGKPKIAQAKQVGAWVAERCKGKGIEKVVFDRNGYQYHGRVRALADAAREGGLTF
jgi:large subunit ribosomal protein L18